MDKKQLELFEAYEDTKLMDAMHKIDVNAEGVLFVVNGRGELCGALSDGDVRRWILRNGSLDVSVGEIMNTSPKYLTEDERDQSRQKMKEFSIRSMPVVDGQRHIVDIELLTENRERTRQNLDARVIIMAGGKGTRLYPFTKILPKPLIPIGDIPIMERIINAFCEYGIRDYYVTVNYKKMMIRSYFSELDTDYRITYVEEDEPLGTAGSIRLIGDRFDRPVFVTNCDVIIRTDYAKLYEYHQSSGNAVTIVASVKNETIPYGVINSREDGIVLNMEEKPSRSYLINTGMYVINPEMIDLIPEGEFFHMTDLANRALEMGLKVGIYPVSEDSFLDMGEFAEMKRMEELLDL